MAEAMRMVETLALILIFSPRRRNSGSQFFVLRVTIQQIQSQVFQ
jgi:hypothetical protein